MDVKVSHVKGETDTTRALRILLACPRCRPMAEALMDESEQRSGRVAVVPCPDCAAKYASGPVH